MQPSHIISSYIVLVAEPGQMAQNWIRILSIIIYSQTNYGNFILKLDYFKCSISLHPLRLFENHILHACVQKATLHSICSLIFSSRTPPTFLSNEISNWVAHVLLHTNLALSSSYSAMSFLRILIIVQWLQLLVWSFCLWFIAHFANSIFQ